MLRAGAKGRDTKLTVGPQTLRGHCLAVAAGPTSHHHQAAAADASFWGQSSSVGAILFPHQ